MGITVDIEKIQIACENTKQNPAEENLFRQLVLEYKWYKLDMEFF
jgi:hypothetical protein